MNAHKSFIEYLESKQVKPKKLAEILDEFLIFKAELLEIDPADPDSIHESYENYLVLHTVEQFRDLLVKKS